MSEPDILWDVYQSPRLDAVQFGNYFAADHAGREPILRAAKYCSRGHRASGREAREVIRNFVTAPVPKLGSLQAARDKFKDRLADPLRTDEQHANDSTNVTSVEKFLEDWDQSKFAGRLIEPVGSEQGPMNVGGVAIRLQIDFWVRGQDKSGSDTVGGVFLNTQKGSGLGSRPATMAARNRGGEAVALLVLQRVINDHSDLGIPNPADCWHYYLRHKKIWAAPDSYVRKLNSVSAAGKTASLEWTVVSPPNGFDPDQALFHP